MFNRGFITEPSEMAEALRGAGNKYVAVHIDETNCIHEAIKVVSVSDDDDPVVAFTGCNPPPPTPISGLRSVQVGS